jgi:hypothetical protein
MNRTNKKIVRVVQYSDETYPVCYAIKHKNGEQISLFGNLHKHWELYNKITTASSNSLCIIIQAVE